MKEKNNQIIWEPQELIYDVGDASNEAFLVIQGLFICILKWFF